MRQMQEQLGKQIRTYYLKIIDKVKLAQRNANGVLNHKIELKAFLIDYDIDITILV